MVAIAKPESFAIPTTGLNCTVKTADLKRAMATLARIADRKSTMAMLQNVLLRVGNDGLTIAATDLNLSGIVTVPAFARSGDGSVCVNAKSLADLVKGLSGDDVYLAQIGGNALSVADGQSNISLMGAHSRDFPKLPDPNGEGVTFHKTEGMAFADMLDRVAYSVCKDETRFHLNGIRFECDGANTRMVTTDGHRLTRHDAKLAGAPTAGVILPAKGASEIAKLCKAHKGYETSVAIKEHMMFVRVGQATIAAKLIDAVFPAYEQVIPKDYAKVASVERKPLIAALKRAQKLTSKTRGVKLAFASGKLTLTCDHPEQGTASESLKACSEWIERPGSTMTFGINASYLLDVLEEIGDAWVTLGFGGELDPVLVRSTDDAVSYSVQGSRFLGVIMPMRI